MTRKASAARNNAAYEQGNGKTVVPYSPSLSLETLDTGILLLSVFTLELETDYPSETSLCTVAPVMYVNAMPVLGHPRRPRGSQSGR